MKNHTEIFYLEEAVSPGEHGCCASCKRYPPNTALINDVSYCGECVIEKFPFDIYKTVEFTDSDAMYRCQFCDKEDLSFREAFIGSCCSISLNADFDVEDRYAELQLVQKIYRESITKVRSLKEESKQAKEDVKEKKNEAKEADKAFEEVEKAVEEAEIAFANLHFLARPRLKEDFKKSKENRKKAIENLKKSEEKSVSADKRLEAEKEFRNEAKKRCLMVTRKFEDDSSDDEGPAKKKSKEPLSTERNECGICCNPYDDEHHEAVLTSCGHKTCYMCITAKLPSKKCAFCKKPFTAKNILKVFNPL
ncbi:Oidioi.mRNA.OKI2018_I69.XSR.g13884.t1.cds [Oikopleura dioica]|uniref:Oidioi.mRNA.OKI2018_I69.XSR.g13884.t1.cds n=1 Tax=Oikopleura dioica TaxID=34765 RepID=A0ABN7S867_OIKDI|nr:Oidioi.mRNA.OKI2018_I69.XSR.g13884.t1.cds [Oikopleura dioica]